MANSAKIPVSPMSEPAPSVMAGMRPNKDPARFPFGTEEKHFAFGQNWRNFLSVLDEKRIAEAEASLRKMLRVNDLAGRSFLDVGSGSGLFSLAARRLGAQVFSFDYDRESVGCTQELRRRYFPADSKSEWRIDIVYSWGVLHHTGHMWRALENVIGNVAPGGMLFISIYNDEGWRSAASKKMKQRYNTAPTSVKHAMVAGYAAFIATKEFTLDVLCRKNPLTRYREKIKSRGMSVWYDIVDWVGGWPYEVATPEALFEFYYQHGFDVVKLRTVPRGHGCNEFVFRRRP